MGVDNFYELAQKLGHCRFHGNRSSVREKQLSGDICTEDKSHTHVPLARVQGSSGSWFDRRRLRIDFLFVLILWARLSMKTFRDGCRDRSAMNRFATEGRNTWRMYRVGWYWFWGTTGVVLGAKGTRECCTYWFGVDLGKSHEDIRARPWRIGARGGAFSCILLPRLWVIFTDALRSNSQGNAASGIFKRSWLRLCYLL